MSFAGLFRSSLAPIAIVLTTGAAALAVSQLPTLADNDAIAYATAKSNDPVARLQQRIDRGETTLAFDPKHGYLPAVLEALHVPVSSQGLVFSRTSLQIDHIAPWSPRALYFNDDTYVGWVQNGPILEAVGVDPTLGAVFYSLDQRATDHPVFERQQRTCLICHDSATTGGVPGFIVRSVFTDRYGYAFASVGKDLTTDRTPIDERWGGWYVTGTAGDSPHMGNVIANRLAQEMDDKTAFAASMKRTAGPGITDLHGKFDVSRYLAPGSDIVALLVLAHQSVIHNLITTAGYVARIDAADGEPDSARVKNAAEKLARAMLFANEAPLPGPVKGTSAFAVEFAARGPKDRQGRSLRDLDLERRLLRYPLSYLIYSDGFDGLPEFGHLSGSDRQAIREILRDTKPDFPAGPTP